MGCNFGGGRDGDRVDGDDGPRDDRGRIHRRARLRIARALRRPLDRHCVECHQPGTAAPFSLLTYEQVKARAATIAEVVEDQRMPPWTASPRNNVSNIAVPWVG